MSQSLRQLFALLACYGAPACALSSGWPQQGVQRQLDLRDAVEAHRASEREEVRREESAAGRRLTPAELAQLRQQVQSLSQSQSQSRGEVTAPAGIAPTSDRARVGATPPAPRLQRP